MLVVSCANFVLKFVRICYMVQNFEMWFYGYLQAPRWPYKPNLVPNSNTCLYKFNRFPEDMTGDNALQDVYIKHVTERQCSVCVIRQTDVYRTAENSYNSCRRVRITVTSAFPWSQWLKTVKGKSSPILRNRLVCHIVNSWRYLSASYILNLK